MRLTEAQKDAYIKRLEEQRDADRRRISLLERRTGALMVDADHREQRALRSANSCEEHGELIKRLEELVAYHDARSTHFESDRGSLLVLLFTLRSFADGDREEVTLKRDAVKKYVRDTERALDRASKKFDKAWAKIREASDS